MHPRGLYVLPNGDVLIVEANSPGGAPTYRPKDLIASKIKAAGGTTGKGGNRITLVRYGPDGKPALRSVFLSNLHSPYGVALVGDQLYVANTDAIVRFPYQTGETSIAAPGVKLTDLPAGPIDHHWTKAMVASPDGSKLYVGVGSNSNITENGMPAELGRAAIYEIDRQTGASRIFASGTRNPTNLTWEPTTGKLWAVVNERDELGPDLVPDYLTSVKDGAFYGWPYSYYGQHLDPRVKPQRPDLVATAIPPDYALELARRAARRDVVRLDRPAGRVSQRHVRRRARQLGPLAAGRLQGGLRAVRRRQAVRHAAGRRDRLPRAGPEAHARPPGRRRDRQDRRAAGRRRRRQHRVARVGRAGDEHRDALTDDGTREYRRDGRSAAAVRRPNSRAAFSRPRSAGPHPRLRRLGQAAPSTRRVPPHIVARARPAPSRAPR